ncbi:MULTISPECIES: hypothetical protein [unclassified Streptomyces]|uniref:hypothetical protein n=1 Tax=unclassified Streptomyces TaxID=2593676 RepID=UPI003814CE95
MQRADRPARPHVAEQLDLGDAKVCADAVRPDGVPLPTITNRVAGIAPLRRLQ